MSITTKSSGPAPRREDSEPAEGDPSADVSVDKPPASPDRERLKALLCQLDEGQNQWIEQVAATLEEDYRQLVKDKGSLEITGCR